MFFFVPSQIWSVLIFLAVTEILWLHWDIVTFSWVQWFNIVKLSFQKWTLSSIQERNVLRMNSSYSKALVELFEGGSNGFNMPFPPSEHRFITDGNFVNKQLFDYIFNKSNYFQMCEEVAGNCTVLHKTMRLFCQDFGQGDASLSRCDLKSNLVAAGCAPSSLESPNSKLQVIEDRPLSNKAAGATQDVTQIKPQKLHITLRPGESLLLTLWFRNQSWK